MRGPVAREGLTSKSCFCVRARTELGTALVVRVPHEAYKSLRRRVFESWDDSMRRDVRVLVATERGGPLQLVAGDTIVLTIPAERSSGVDSELRVQSLRMLCDKYSGIAHRALVTATW